MRASIKTSATFLAAVAVSTLYISSVRAQDPVKAPPRITDPALLKPVTQTPKGEYVQARFVAQVGWPMVGGTVSQPVPTTMVAGFRDGALVSFWAVGASGGGNPWLLHSTTVRLTDQGLSGDLEIKICDAGGRVPVPMVLKLTRKGATLTGTVKVASGAEVPAEGAVETASEAAKHNGLAADKAWPGWYGVDASVRGPTSGVKLVESLTQARPVWRSEEELKTGYGNANGPHRGLIGGASSSVVSNGRLYHYHYRANPKSPIAHVHRKAAYLDPALKKAEAFPPDVKADALDIWRVAADDIVVAMDAATGRTLWRTVLPMRCPNMCAHKFRGVNPTPLVVGKELYVLSYDFRMYKLDADTGTLLWEYPDTPTQSYAPFSGPNPVEMPFRGNELGAPSPVLIGQTLAFTLGGEIIAIDAGTGKERWRKPTGGRARLYTWNLNGQPHFLTSADTRGSAEKQLVSVFRPDDGQMVWQSPAPFDFQFTGYMLPVLSGDLLFGLRFDMSDKTGSKSAVVAARLTPKGIEPVWEVNPLMERFDAYQLAERDGFLYVTGYKEVWVIETKTGKVVAKVPGAGGMATPVIFTAEDRVFIYPEGRHGGSQVIMLIAAGADTRVLSPDIATGGNMAGWNGTWTVPHPSTTAYAVGQLIHPIVDGRLFVRGADGIYCYDLRAASKP